MIEQINKLLASVGLNPVWASVLALLAAGLIWFVRRHFALKDKLSEAKFTYENNLKAKERELQIAYENTKRAKIDDALLQYSKLQCSELLEVHRMLYESGEITETVEVADFKRKIKEADQRILKPLTDFHAFLHEPAVKRLIYPIHNILDQFKYTPSKDAIKAFLSFRQSFYDLIARAINEIESVYVVGGKSK